MIAHYHQENENANKAREARTKAAEIAQEESWTEHMIRVWFRLKDYLCIRSWRYLFSKYMYVRKSSANIYRCAVRSRIWNFIEWSFFRVHFFLPDCLSFQTPAVFKCFFFFYHTSLVIPTTQMPSLTPLASFFQGPALKISQLTKPAPFSGLFPLASPIVYIGDLPSPFAIGGKVGAKEFDSYSIQLTRP